MYYMIPTWQKLMDLSFTLAVNYKGTNEKHLAYLKFFQILIEFIEKNVLDEGQKRKIACGGLFFVLYRIENEEERAQSSTLMSFIKMDLGLSENNPCTEIDRFVLLVEIYNFIKQIKNESMLDEDVWLKSVLFEETCQQILIQLIIDNSDKMKYLFKMPSSSALNRQLMDLKNQYESIKYNRMFGYDMERDRQVNLILKIHESFPKNINGENDIYHEVCEEAYMCTMGIVLYTAMQINRSYNFSSAENSQLYKLCKDVLQVTRLCEIPDKVKAKWLKSLKQYLGKKFLHDGEESHNVNNQENNQLINAIQKEIEELVRKIALHAKSVTTQAVDFAKKTGYSVLAETLASQTSSTVGYAVDAGAAVAGYTFFGPPGGLFASQVSRVTRETILPELIKYGLVYVCKKIESNKPENILLLKDIEFKFTKESFLKWLAVCVQYEIFSPIIYEWGDAFIHLTEPLFATAVVPAPSPRILSGF